MLVVVGTQGTTRTPLRPPPTRQGRRLNVKVGLCTSRWPQVSSCHPRVMFGCLGPFCSTPLLPMVRCVFVGGGSQSILCVPAGEQPPTPAAPSAPGPPSPPDPPAVAAEAPGGTRGGPGGATEGEEEEEKAKAKRLLYCALCKVAVNSLSQLEAHNKGGPRGDVGTWGGDRKMLRGMGGCGDVGTQEVWGGIGEPGDNDTVVTLGHSGTSSSALGGGRAVMGV